MIVSKDYVEPAGQEEPGTKPFGTGHGKSVEANGRELSHFRLKRKSLLEEGYHA